MIWLYHERIADRQEFDRHFAGATIGALQDRGLRRELRQRLDRTFCPAHGIMLECMAKTEEEEQQRAFRPSTQGRRARRGNEHQRVDLEALELQILDRFAADRKSTRLNSSH